MNADKLLALIKQARSDYRASDAAGDVLDWLEERALAQPAEAAQGDGMVPVAYYYRRGKEERGPYMLPNTGGDWMVAAGYKEILLYEKV